MEDQAGLQEMVIELIGEAVQESGMRPCRELVGKLLVDGSWKELEIRRLVKVVEGGGVGMRKRVEEQLRSLREDEEAMEALLAEAEASTRRME